MLRHHGFKHPICFDPGTLTLLAIGLAGAGIATSVGAMSHQPEMPAAPALPDPLKAKDNAQQNLLNQRRTLLASGGQTDYTGGSGGLSSGDINKTILLGN